MSTHVGTIPAAFVNNHMFLGTFGEDVILRLDEGARAELLKKKGTKLFEPMAGRPMKEYVVVPRAWRDDVETARAWVARSLTWARSLAPKPSKPRPKPKK